LFGLVFPPASPGQTITELVGLTDHPWLYNDTATDLGTSWRTRTYAAESTWPSGTALFGVESSSPYPYPAPLRTALVLNAGRTTYYFRTHFTFNGTPTNLILLATAEVDDGAVFYLNGTEAGRVRMPAGPIQFSTKAQLNHPEGPPALIEFPLNALVSGDNVLAVEVHQASDTSSDVVFGMFLETYTLEAPRITVAEQPVDTLLSPGQAATLEVFANGYPALSYQWFKDGAALPGATSSTLVLPAAGGQDAGSYYVVVTNRVGSTTSRVASVTFQTDRTPPRVLYAMGLSSANEVRVVFSEPVEQSIAEDYLNWSMESPEGAPGLSVVTGHLENGTNLVLTTAEARAAGTRYHVIPTVPIPDLYDNSLPDGTIIPIALFDSGLVSATETQVWRYHQLGIDLGTDWVLPSYAEQTWPEGSSPFDAYRSNPQDPACREFLPGRVPVRTCLTLSNQLGTAQIPTVYFRTHFNFSGEPSDGVLRFDTTVNDGAVFYLNGTEVLRVGMPSGSPTYQTLADRLAGDNSEQFDVPARGLVSGDNVLAVELHQQSLTSFDLTLALKVDGVFANKPTTRPRLELRIAGEDLELTWSPASAALETSVTMSGPWSVITPSDPPGRHLTPRVDPQRFYRLVAPE
jgi:hypothetical protein